MTVAGHNVVAAFEALDPEEQRQVAVEILRRTNSAGELPEAAFDELAAEVFRAYDAEESTSANS